MNLLVIALFVVIFCLDYLMDTLGTLPRYLIVIPELLSVFAAVAVIACAIAYKHINLSRRYVFFYVLLSLTMLIGIVGQAVPVGAVIAGLRDYLRFIPFFLLPAVYRFAPRALKIQLAVLLSLLAMQVPISVYQRFGQYGSKLHTGDFIVGTVSTSGVLSLLMLSCIAVVAALYMRKKISLPVMLMAGGFFFLPTTINETKVTLLLLPVCVFAPMIFMPRGRRSVRKLIPIMGVTLLAGLAFVSIYDYFSQFRQYGSPISSFLFEEDRFRNYVYQGTVSGADGLRRLDSLEVAVTRLAENPLALTFGLGIGNVSKSVASNFDGTYSNYYELYGIGMTQVTTFLWEIGVVGSLSFLLVFFFLYRDARFLARNDEMLGQLWATIMLIMTFALLYDNIFSVNEIGYPFWFYSGIVASRARQLRRSVSVPGPAQITGPRLSGRLGAVAPATVQATGLGG